MPLSPFSLTILENNAESKDDNSNREEKVPITISLRPMVNFAVFGMTVIAPVTHYFYRMLDTVLPPSPSNSVKVYRLLLDRMVLAPLLSVSTIAALEVLQVIKVFQNCLK